MKLSDYLIEPNWPDMPSIHAVATTRLGGVSGFSFQDGKPTGPNAYHALNLGDHVGDEIRCVETNRSVLAEALGLAPEYIYWLTQVHGTEVAPLNLVNGQGHIEADAAFTTMPWRVCTVMTADCLPVLFADPEHKIVAAAHAGWRGLAAGVLENTLAQFPDPKTVRAWFGPAISQAAFEVGSEVRESFLKDSSEAEAAFVEADEADKWFADLYQLARVRLQRAGLEHIYGGDFCTYTDAERFYSYRRDGQISGRQACLIWME